MALSFLLPVACTALRLLRGQACQCLPQVSRGPCAVCTLHLWEGARCGGGSSGHSCISKGFQSFLNPKLWFKLQSDLRKMVLEEIMESYLLV